MLAVLRWAIAGGAVAAPGVYNMGGPQSLSRDAIARAVARHQRLDAGGTCMACSNMHPMHVYTRASSRAWHARHQCLDAAGIRAVPRAGGGGVRSPPDITMDSTKLERAAGLRFRPLAEMLAPALGEPQ